MRLREIMTPHVETILASEPARAAFERMRARRIHHLVVMRGRDIVGVLSERDLLPAPADGQSVEETMSAPVITATPDTTVRRAANLLRGRAIGCIPVVEGRRLKGIVTITDLLERIGQGAERPVAKSRRWVMKGRGPRRKPVAANGAGARRLR